jgi:8-oxo-dGTP pyrophosphatase MutT (NUDIX family)
MFTDYYNPDRQSIRAILFDQSGSSLLFHGVQRGKLHPFYTTFGGGIEEGETPVQTLHRELHEELDATALVGEHEMFALFGHHYYVAKVLTLGDSPFTHGPEYQKPGDQKFSVKKVKYAHAYSREFNLQPKAIKEILKDYGKIILKARDDLS